MGYRYPRYCHDGSMEISCHISASAIRIHFIKPDYSLGISKNNNPLLQVDDCGLIGDVKGVKKGLSQNVVSCIHLYYARYP